MGYILELRGNKWLRWWRDICSLKELRIGLKENWFLESIFKRVGNFFGMILGWKECRKIDSMFYSWCQKINKYKINNNNNKQKKT